MNVHLFRFLWKLLFLIVGFVSTSAVRVPCKTYEVLACGDVDREWSICHTKTPGVNRIASAQLDTRFANRYCRRYGTPENFGLTSSGRAMWTVGWCYGTFFLCLDIDPDFNSDNETDPDFNSDNETDPDFNSDNETDIEDDSYDYDTRVTPDLLSDQAIKDSDTNTTETSVVEPNTTSGLSFDEDLISLERQNYVKDGNLIQSELTQAKNHSTRTDDQDETVDESIYGINPRLKFWLIFGIAMGGLIIVILIGVIAYLSMQCCDYNTEESPVCKPKNSSNEKYFRQQKWSTSALMTSESDYCTDVYDFIPAKTSKKKYSSKFTTISEPNNKQKENNTFEKVNDNSQRKHVDRLGSSQRSDTPQKHDYFVLIPQNISDSASNSENDSTQVYAQTTENIYDKLIYSPAVSLDASTYHHLNFQREVNDNVKNDESEKCINT